MEEYKKIIREEHIDCSLTETDAYVYSADGEKLRQEAEAAQRLGIDAVFKEKIEIPVSCAGAVCFPCQAEFHPLKFIEALAERLTIYEDTRVTEVEENLVRTARGSVKADKIIFAVHFPFINFPGMYFARMHQERSYVLALENAGSLDGMYIGDGEDALSFRQYDKYILFGGQDWREPGGQAVREAEGRCQEAVSCKLCGGLLVGAGLYHSRQHPVYRAVCCRTSRLARDNGIPEVGYELFHGVWDAA